VSPPCGSTCFTLSRVTVDYGRGPALDALDLRIEPGEAVAFVGPSGAGKTTLLRVLAGSVRPTRGSVAVNGRELRTLGGAELREARACIGFVYQDLSLVPNVRVVKNVLSGRLGRLSLGRSLRSMLFPPREFLVEAHRILDRVGIGEKMYERTDRLSGGQRQRVAVARALFQEPGALIADEPVSSVDPARARDLVRLLWEVSRERRLTLCASLHDLELAREFFPRLVGLRRGRFAFDSPASALDASAFERLYRLEPDEVLADSA
jgi:phosphonate transport system ATP-binding protein